MGIYLAIVGIADLRFKGSYLWKEYSWKTSSLCSFAGILSILSSECSAIMIFLITLDRLIVLRFPFTQIRFKRSSAIIASIIVWILCFILVCIPLTTIQLSDFYSQVGVCMPLPVNVNHDASQKYSFAILIVFNFIVFSCVAFGQAAIFATVKKSSADTKMNMTLTNPQKTKFPSEPAITVISTTSQNNSISISYANCDDDGDSCNEKRNTNINAQQKNETSTSQVTRSRSKELVLARRLLSVVVSNFLCWFPIGLLGICASQGIQFGSEVNVIVAIFVMPLNSGLNPFLYTINTLIEKRKARKYSHLLKTLEAKLKIQAKTQK